MEDHYGCALMHCHTGGQLPGEFTGSCHVHLLMRQGEMSFSDGKNAFTSRKDDLVLWQMSNTIQSMTYSDDFEADVLLASPGFLQQYNPEMVWASQWIQYFAAFELVSLLNDTTKTLSEVSDLMHFENISHFSRYVKKMLGKTPSEFRNK